MRYKVEEAIIIETYEVEPVYPVELIEVELIRDGKRSRGLGSLFGSLFDNIIDHFFHDDNDLNIIQENEAVSKPEVALIVQTEEIPVNEVRYFYAEILE